MDHFELPGIAPDADDTIIQKALTPQAAEQDTSDPERMACPFCAESIMKAAKKCRFCGEWLDASARQVPSTPSRPVLAGPAASGGGQAGSAPVPGHRTQDVREPGSPATRSSAVETAIKVFGVGDGGSNAVHRIIATGVIPADVWVVNTDATAIANSTADKRLLIGVPVLKGLGAGGRAARGQAAAEAGHEDFRAAIEDARLVVLVAGMGGGTGTGAAPVMAAVAREAGALVVGIVTTPFTFEGARRLAQSRFGVEALRQQVDYLIVIPNDALLQMADRRTSIREAFQLADSVVSTFLEYPISTLGDQMDGINPMTVEDALRMAIAELPAHMTSLWVRPAAR